MRCGKPALALLFSCLLFVVAPASAQMNPPPADCGLPAAGVIRASVIWTLTADCEQTGELLLSSPPAGDPGYTVTINGEGHTIRLGDGTWAFLFAGTVQQNTVKHTINLNNVTIDSQFKQRPTVLTVEGTLNAQQVTFTRGHTGIFVKGITATLSDVLFLGILSTGIGFGANGALNVPAGSSATLNNVVFRDTGYNGVVVHSGGTLTTNGCLSFSGTPAYNVIHSGVWSGAGTWNDSNTGPCSGTIGNGDQAVLPAPALLACGMPASALVDEDVTWTLIADCEGVGNYHISEGVTVSIIGNGHRLASSATRHSSLAVGGGSSLSIDNLVMERVRLLSVDGALTVTRSELRNTERISLINFGGVNSFSNTLFEDNSSPSYSSLYHASNLYHASETTFRDVIFRNNSGGDAMLRVRNSATLNLEDCIISENNQAPDFLTASGATVNDNRGSCADPPVVGVVPTASGGSGRGADGTSERGSSHNCFQRLGAIGLICRVMREPGSTIQVWGVTPDSEGFFILEVMQLWVDAVTPAGLVTCSADGRVAVRVHRNRNVTVSMGPNPEGKVHHVQMERHLNGPVISTVDTYSGLPCPPGPPLPPMPTAWLAPFVARQAPRADGSLVHVVREGDTLHAIAIAYGFAPQDLVERNRLVAGGHWLIPGQELLIRHAHASEAAAVVTPRAA